MMFLELEFLDNTVLRWLIALGITLVVWGVLRLMKVYMVRRLTALARRIENDVDDLLATMLLKTKMFLMAILALYAGSLALELPEAVTLWAGKVTVIALIVQAAFWGDAIIDYAIVRYQKRQGGDEASSYATPRVLSIMARAVLIAVVVLLALDNIPGVEVTTLIASLGIGGLAVALALQNVLTDLFASLSIALDKPFVIGDYIVLDDYQGTVEHVGLKSTRVRSLSGEQIVVGNSDLLKSRIRNYKRMEERRVAFSIGVTYETPKAKLEKIPQIAQELIQAQENVRFDRAHFKSFGDFSLDYEIVYFMVIPDYTAFMDTQQAINLGLIERFAEEGIEFAYPTQMLYVSRPGAEPPEAVP